jgi:hypothetical protein
VVEGRPSENERPLAVHNGSGRGSRLCARGAHAAGWLEAWGGIDGVLSGMNRQDYAPLPQSPFGWRAEFCQTQVNTSPTLIGQGSAPEPWRAVRLAALDTLKRDQQQ